MTDSTSGHAVSPAAAGIDPAAAKIPSPHRSGLKLPRPRKHWTPRYVVNRVALWWWQKQNPEAPWLTADAVNFLSTWLRPGDTVAEFGSGRSTLFFARQVGPSGFVASAEHHEQWHTEVTGRLKSAGISNTVYALAPKEEAGYIAAASTALAGRRPNLALVDGLHRDACALWAMDAVRPGGIVAIDNVQRYLPHRTFAPYAIGQYGAPASPRWQQFWATASTWRCLWTSNGIEDTVFFFKPDSAQP